MKLFRTSLTVGYALLHVLLFAVLLPTRNIVTAEDNDAAATVETNTTVDSTTSIKNTTDTSDTADDTIEGSDAGTEVSADGTVPPPDPPADYYGEDVPFSDFVAHTSRTIPAGAGINGLYLTLGNSVDDTDTDDASEEEEDAAGSCVIGTEVITGNLHNIMHTIEPVFYNEKTNSTPSITVSSYPENLIETIVFGQDKVGGYHKFLRLEYNEEMVRKSMQNTNQTLHHYYGVLIQFPSDELEEVHVGGDLIVKMKEGFTNTSLVRATDRTQVDVSYDGENTMYVRSSQQSQVTLDVGHHDDLTEYVQSEKEKIRAIASGSSIMKISGTVERMECVQNATCVVDGPILSEDCNDSIVAMNATLETDDCSCVVVVNPTAPITQLIKNGTTNDSDSMTATTKASSALSFYNNENHTASCIDTTYIPSVIAETDGPSTTNQTFACPADVMTVPLFTPPAPPATMTEDEKETSSTTTAGEEEVDMSNPTNTSNSNNTTGTTNSTEKTNDEEEEEEETASTKDEGQFIQIAWETDDSGASSRTLSVPAMTMLMIMIMTVSIVCLLVQELLEVVEEYTDKKQAPPEDAFSTVRTVE